MVKDLPPKSEDPGSPGLDPWVGKREEEMATHSSIPAWRIPRTEEPGGLRSTGTQRVRHDLDMTLLTQTITTTTTTCKTNGYRLLC